MADQGEFHGQVALVTAAAGRGIGQAVARRLAAGNGIRGGYRHSPRPY